jgi:hypothetical protein
MPCPAASAVQQLITDAHVPGLSMAVLDDRQATALTVGVRNSLDRAAVVGIPTIATTCSDRLRPVWRGR